MDDGVAGKNVVHCAQRIEAVFLDVVSGEQIILDIDISEQPVHGGESVESYFLIRVVDRFQRIQMVLVYFLYHHCTKEI
jgi:hypothetical protein